MTRPPTSSAQVPSRRRRAFAQFIVRNSPNDALKAGLKDKARSALVADSLADRLAAVVDALIAISTRSASPRAYPHAPGRRPRSRRPFRRSAPGPSTRTIRSCSGRSRPPSRNALVQHRLRQRRGRPPSAIPATRGSTSCSPGSSASSTDSALTDDVGLLDRGAGTPVPASPDHPPTGRAHEQLYAIRVQLKALAGRSLPSTRTPKQSYPIAPRGLAFFLAEHLLLLAGDASLASLTKTPPRHRRPELPPPGALCRLRRDVTARAVAGGARGRRCPPSRPAGGHRLPRSPPPRHRAATVRRDARRERPRRPERAAAPPRRAGPQAGRGAVERRQAALRGASAGRSPSTRPCSTPRFREDVREGPRRQGDRPPRPDAAPVLRPRRPTRSNGIFHEYVQPTLADRHLRPRPGHRPAEHRRLVQPQARPPAGPLLRLRHRADQLQPARTPSAARSSSRPTRSP